jgi:hypothetical protein
MSYTNGLDKPDDYFNTLIYTGDGVGGRALDVGFATDLFWVKHRNGANVHYLTDSVRGPLKGLQSNSTDAETTFDSVRSFTSTGVTVGTSATTNNSGGNTFAAWNWLGGGTGVSNTAGSITSTVSANTTSGFSIVSYTGNGTSGATVGHGLGAVPQMIIVKNRDAADAWQVYHAANTANPETDYLVLNTTAATADNINRWNDTLPTSTLFSIGNGVEVNTNTEKYIAYCFAEKKGFSKFSSYIGNGSSDGPFVYTGFKPAFIILKQSSSAGNSWQMMDNKRNTSNVLNKVLYPDLSSAEDTTGATSNTIDFVSNGFKSRGSNGQSNASGSTYIYMAFAENPFVTSTGIPTTAR